MFWLGFFWHYFNLSFSTSQVAVVFHSYQCGLMISSCSSQTVGNMSRPSERDPEKEWLEKLFGECEDEFNETFGVYDGKFKHIF